jgi:hypothetical protein
MVNSIEDALGRSLGQEPAAEVDIRADDNIELVSRLLEDLRSGQRHAVPGALVLPVGSAEDKVRWLKSWPEVGPSEAVAWLGLPEDSSWESVVEAVYVRFADHWAAGVSFHH